MEERIAVLAACASINSLALGYSVGCTAAIAPLIKRAFDLSVVELVVFEAAIPLFAVVGALVASYVAEPIGRRRAFFIGALFFLALVPALFVFVNFQVRTSFVTIVWSLASLCDSCAPCVVAAGSRTEVNTTRIRASRNRVSGERLATASRCERLRAPRASVQIGSIIEAFSPSYAILLVGTAIVGIGNGFGTSIDPMYIAEARRRRDGRLDLGFRSEC